MGNQLNAAEQWDRLKPYAAGAIQRAADAAVARALAAAGRPASAGGGAGGGGGGGSGGGGGVAAHVLATTTGLSSKHTVSGLTAGQVLQATGATTALFGVLSHTYLTDLTTGDPHTQYALRARQIIAGNGMSGGGTLAADRTLTLGTPSTITDSTTNAVTTSSHTHAVDAYASRVTGQSGILRANDGALTLSTLKSESLISNTELTVTPGTYVVLSDGKALRTASYSSGFAGGGLQLDQGVSATGLTSFEVDNLSVRGIMRVYELLIQKIRATNGSIIVSSTGKIATRALYSGTEGALNSQYTLNTDTEAGHGFAVGDLIRAQKYTGSGTYQSNMEVVGVYSTSNFRAQLLGGVAPAVGYEYVRLGSTSDASRRGGVYMTADDVNAPFVDVFDGVNSWAAWGSANKLKVRLGRLDGITSGTNEYGLWAGSLTYGNIIVSGDRVALRQGTSDRIVFAADGTSYFAGVMTIGTSGEIRQGTGTLGSDYTGLRVWRSGSVGLIGGYNNDVIQWQATTAGKLTAGAGALTLDASGIALAAYAGANFSDIGNYSIKNSGVERARFGYKTYLSVETATVGLMDVARAEFLSSAAAASAALRADTTALTVYGSPAAPEIRFNVPVNTESGIALTLKQDSTNVLLAQKTSGENYLQLGAGRAADGLAYIDLVGDTTYTDYGLRMLRNSGANGNTQMRHRGTGDWQFYADEAASYKWYTSATLYGQLLSTGEWGLGGAATAGYAAHVRGSLKLGDSAAARYYPNATFTVAQNAVLSLGATTFAVGMMLNTTDGTATMFILRGSANLVNLFGTGGAFSTTAGTASNINIYYSAGNSRYEVENKYGATRTLAMHLFYAQ